MGVTFTYGGQVIMTGLTDERVASLSKAIEAAVAGGGPWVHGLLGGETEASFLVHPGVAIGFWPDGMLDA